MRLKKEKGYMNKNTNIQTTASRLLRTGKDRFIEPRPAGACKGEMAGRYATGLIFNFPPKLS